MNREEFRTWMLSVRAWRPSVARLFASDDDSARERARQWRADLSAVPLEVANESLEAMRRGEADAPDSWSIGDLPRYVLGHWHRHLHEQRQRENHERFRVESASRARSQRMTMVTATEMVREALQRHKIDNDLEELPSVDEVPGLRERLDGAL